MQTNQQRVEVIDAVRGFALFGILLVNMTLFQFGMFGSEKPTHVLGRIDKGAHWFIEFFGTYNFITLFSLLFGISIIMLQESILRKEQRFFPIYIRRIILLLVIGQMHSMFLWNGDILYSYGILGICLMPFINRKPKTLLIWSMLLILFNTIFSYFTPPPQEKYADKLVPFANKETELHETGSYIDHVFFRTYESPIDQLGLGAWGPLFILVSTILSMLPIFLLGLYIGKKGWLLNTNQYQPVIKKVWFISGILSFSIKTLSLIGFFSFLIPFKQNIVPLSTAIFYGTSIILLFNSKNIVFKHMANVGKMSVSNYLAQSFICTTIFYAYGLGLFGKVGSFGGILLTILIYIAQMLVSSYWLKKFRMGPVEYVWRFFTYWKRPVFKRT